MAITDFLEMIKELNLAFIEWNLTHGRDILDVVHIVVDNIFYFFLYITIGLTMFYLVLSLFSIFSKKRYPEKKFDIKDAPKVTIQIPTRNEIVALRCAKRCLEFDYPKDKFEIIIGDDSNDKEVSMKLNEFAEKHDLVRVIKRAKNIGFKPGNLNNMLKHSKGELIVIFDSDFTPDKDFLKRIVAPFVNEKNVSAVQARWNFNNFNQNIVTVLASTIVYIFHHIVLDFMKRHDHGSLCGSAEAVRKSDLIELGSWKSGSLTEDVEYALRLHNADKRIVYLPKLECYSDVPHLAIDLYKQQMRWAYGVINSYILHSTKLIFNDKLSIKKKMLSFFAGFGYFFPVMIFALFISGNLSFLTATPGPIDIPRFLSETGINILLTSGLIVASLVSLYHAKKTRYFFKMLVSSFSIGIITTFYVNIGIFKSILGKPMQWYLLNKSSDYDSK